jgi:thiamine transport system ATP-binding protein
MLSLQQVSYVYRNTTPFCFNLSLETGKICALIGASGAGKSTLLSLVGGFLKPQSGKVMFNKEDLLPLSPHQRPVSMLFQEHNVFPHLSVYQNIGLGIHPALKLTPTQKTQIELAAEKVGLQDHLNRLPDQLSGGQKQRIALARCLVRDRPLLLLDEPFSALDPALRLGMLALVKELAHAQNMTVLMITHHPEDARKIADSCAFMDEGKIVVFDSPQKVLDFPQHPALCRYLGKTESVFSTDSR